MGLEALVLDRQHRVYQVARHLVEQDQLALLAVGPVIGSDLLRLDQQRPHLALARQRATSR